MCGIAGMWSVRPGDSQGRHVSSMIAAQAHRGPDHQAILSVPSGASTLVLGHCRLMIVDLSPGANQPMWDHARRCCLVFNGEIYNYRELRDELVGLGHAFETRSDSEVVLEAFKEWGTRAFERLNGMFAFALFERSSLRLYLVRDRFGVKPLHYLHADGRLWFSSTSGAIQRLARLDPDLRYLARGIRYWVYDDEDLSPFLGLRTLRAGHYLEVRTGSDGRLGLEHHPYYSLDQRVRAAAQELAGSSEGELCGRFAALIDRAVRLRLRVDVPVGVSLSGGLDSSTVAALSHSIGHVVGFTFGHPEAGGTEGPVVARLERQIGLRVHFVHPGITSVVDGFFAALEAQEAPFPSGSIVGQYLVYQSARAHGIKVVLGGQGSDEVFMGYRKFQLFHLRQLLHRKRLWSALAFAASVVPELLAELPRAAPYWRLRHRYTRSSGIPTALRLPPPEPIGLALDLDRPLWERQLHDVQHTSLPTLLRYEDRNSMAHGVESRLPYLDYPLVEFALALPVSLKLRHGYRKWIVREFTRGRIHETIRRARYKRGFDVEQGIWIERGLGAAIRDRLQDAEDLVRPYLPDHPGIEALFSDARLKDDASAFSEATTLLWLASQSRGNRGRAAA